MVVTFFGHADFSKEKVYRSRMLALLEEQVGSSPVEFLLGGYGRFDHFAYACAKEFQSTHPNARLILVTPYITPSYQKNQLDFQKDRYDEILYPGLEGRPLRFAITYRNRSMVERADLVVAYVTHEYGGAYQALLHAKRRHKAIINLAKTEARA